MTKKFRILAAIFVVGAIIYCIYISGFFINSTDLYAAKSKYGGIAIAVTLFCCIGIYIYYEFLIRRKRKSESKY